ncbi:MAG: alpha/beta hydrolase [Deltaproteobacteria bacterium]|nr:alpha/beta hydrolase [Deltaproteobacteria bacterium]
MALSLLSFFWSSALLHYRALAVLLRNVAPEDPPWFVRIGGYAVDEREREFHPPAGVLRGKLYIPRDCDRPPGLLLVHGIHHLGMNEPRSKSFARALASAGVLVLAPEIPELTDYRVVTSTIGEISACARYLADMTGRTVTGVIGISFAGGLALMAAADPKWQQSIGFVVAVGAHHDLTRVVRYYAGDQIRGPEGPPYSIPPHPYGARVFLYSYLDRLFSAQDLPLARDVFRTYLHDEHRLARSQAQELSADGKRLMLQLLDQKDHETLRRVLMPLLTAHEDNLKSVSPRGKLARLNAQVLLIHGADDPIVPATETPWLAREIPPYLLRQALVSPVIRHAEIEQKPAATEYLKLVRFIAELLALTYKEPAVKRR